MYVITLKNTEEVVSIGESLSYLENGYPILVDENICFDPQDVDIHKIESTPSTISNNKYCYNDEKGFYENPNWTEPDVTNIYGIPDSIYHQIKNQAIAEVQQEVTTNVNI